MSREIVINSTKHESRIAVLDDGQVVELWIERTRHRTVVGNIYKGRVTKVLPGMQSAFVDLGLDRDAFLYVSDVLEEFEEYETESAGDITLDEVPAARPETSISDLLREGLRRRIFSNAVVVAVEVSLFIVDGRDFRRQTVMRIAECAALLRANDAGVTLRGELVHLAATDREAVDRKSVV